MGTCNTIVLSNHRSKPSSQWRQSKICHLKSPRAQRLARRSLPNQGGLGQELKSLRTHRGRARAREPGTPQRARWTTSYSFMSAQLDRLKTALADRYAIDQEIGSGGMATVYLAEDLKHHRWMAVKVLRPRA